MILMMSIKKLKQIYILYKSYMKQNWIYGNQISHSLQQHEIWLREFTSGKKNEYENIQNIKK